MQIQITKDHPSGFKKGEIVDSVHTDRLLKIVNDGYAIVVGEEPSVEEDVKETKKKK